MKREYNVHYLVPSIEATMSKQTEAYRQAIDAIRDVALSHSTVSARTVERSLTTIDRFVGDLRRSKADLQRRLDGSARDAAAARTEAQRLASGFRIDLSSLAHAQRQTLEANQRCQELTQRWVNLMAMIWAAACNPNSESDRNARFAEQMANDAAQCGTIAEHMADHDGMLFAMFSGSGAWHFYTDDAAIALEEVRRNRSYDWLAMPVVANSVKPIQLVGVIWVDRDGAEGDAIFSEAFRILLARAKGEPHNDTGVFAALVAGAARFTSLD